MYWKKGGMFSTGETKPDRITMGIINTKQNTMACCIFFDMEEIASPIPTELAVKHNKPKNMRKKFPLNGMLNHKTAIMHTNIACSKPMIIGGVALARRI